MITTVSRAVFEIDSSSNKNGKKLVSKYSAAAEGGWGVLLFHLSGHFMSTLCDIAARFVFGSAYNLRPLYRQSPAGFSILYVHNNCVAELQQFDIRKSKSYAVKKSVVINRLLIRVYNYFNFY